MTKYKAVSISKNAFIFCRYSTAVLIWLSFIFHIKWLLLAVFLIFALSAMLKIRRAPLIVFYNFSLGKIVKSQEEIVNEHAVSFMHGIASTFGFVCVLFLYFINAQIGWGLVFLFAILKTISAFGMCPAAKLYECAGGGSCCAFSKKHD